MELIQTYAKEIASLLAPFVTWLLNSSGRQTAKLLIGQPHKFTFLVPEPITDAQGNVVRPTQTVKTVSHIVHNAGRQAATRVELVLNWKPKCVNLWPLRHFEEKATEDGRYVMVFPSLAPGESINLEVLDLNRDLPDLVNVRSDQCLARVVEMAPQRVLPPWMRKLFALSFWAGIAAIAYLVISVLQWVLLTPR